MLFAVAFTAAQAQIWVGDDGHVNADLFSDSVEIVGLTVSTVSSKTTSVDLEDAVAWLDPKRTSHTARVESVELCQDGEWLTVDLETGKQTWSWAWWCGSINVRIEGDGFSVEGWADLPDLDTTAPSFAPIWASESPLLYAW